MPAHLREAEIWKPARLKHLARIWYGLSQPPDYHLEGTPLVRATNVKRGNLVRDGLVFVDEIDLPNSRVIRLQEGDVIVVRSGAYTGDSATVSSEWVGAVAGYDMVVRARDEVLLPGFLGYSMLSHHVLDQQIVPLRMRAAQPHLNALELGEVLLTIPRLSEQKSIVDFLDRKTAAVDALIERKERLIALLEEKRQALITQAVTKGLDPNVPMKDSGVEWLGKVPAHWDVRPIGYLTATSGGCTPSKDREEFWDGDIPWVSPKDMKVGLLFGSEDHVSRKALLETGLSLVAPPVVLIVVRGMILGRHFPVALTQVPVTLNQDMKALRPVGCISAPYLALSLRGLEPAALSLVEEAGHGTKRLRTDLWSRFPIPVPPLEEQQRIVSVTEGSSTELAQLATRLEDGVVLLREYRQALITAAVTGKIDVTKEAVS